MNTIGLFGIIKNELKKQDKLPAKYEGLVFPINTIPKMTSNTKPEGKATSNSAYATAYKTYNAYMAFNGGSDGAVAERSSLTLTYTYASTQDKGTYKFQFSSAAYPYEPKSVTVSLQKEDDTWATVLTESIGANQARSIEKKITYRFKAIKFYAARSNTHTGLRYCQCIRTA